MKIEEIEFYGHANVTGTHKSTLEITTDETLTEKGDCIIGIKANKSCKTLTSYIKQEINKDNNELMIEIIVEKMKLIVKAKGNSKLTLKNNKDIVLRKSKFTCSRTIGIEADKAAIDIPRTMIEKLKNSKTKGILRIKTNNRNFNNVY